MPDIKRLQYTDGQLLDVTDFKDEQFYHRDMRMRHNRFVHSWGIVEGLTVTIAGRKVTIAPGMALDKEGQELCLHSPATLDLADELKNTARYVTAKFEEESAMGFTKDKVKLYDRRTIERAKVEVTSTDTKPDIDGSVIVLATLKADPEGKITDDPSARSRSVGSRIESTLSVAGGLAVGATYAKTNAAPANCLLVEGNVGIGTTAPGANLDVGGKHNTPGQVSLQLRSGNNSANYDSNQITLGHSNRAEYRHAIKTRHNATVRSGNAIDFYVWKYLSANEKDAKETIGTLHTMTLDGGNVGIGTTAPGAKLEVAVAAADAATKPLVVGKGSTNYLTMLNNGNVGMGATVPGAKLEVAVAAADAATNPLVVGKGATNYLTMLNNGNVGIGTADPKSTLSVAGGLAVGTTYAKTNAAPANCLLVEGNVGIGTTDATIDLQFRNVVKGSKVEVGRKAAKAHDAGNVPSELSLGIYDGGFSGVRIANERKPSNDGNNQYICFHTHLAREHQGERMRIAPNGFVGIGTSNPGAKLQVNGSILQNLDVIDTKKNGDWENQNHPIVQYFKEKLRGQPKGTFMKAYQNHEGWENRIYEAWVSSSNPFKIIITHFYVGMNFRTFADN